MQIEIAPDVNMAMDGKAILRSLQNNSTPHLDLFVREGLQNSLDAVQEGQEAKLEIRTGSLLTAQIARHLGGIETELNARFPGQAPYLMLRDTGTEGLSGPVRHQDVTAVRGNLRKLVYEIARPQDRAGAGGSWGFGKTIYFRLGIGLVLYYSRFRNPETGGFESRLAASLVEDQTAEDSLLAGAPRSRGIAWWGQSDPLYPAGGSTIPLTDEQEIAAVLQDFGIVPYTGEETGTTILVPFIDRDKLLDETKSALDEGGADPSTMPYWHRNLEDYLDIAVQRWYAPRLDNRADFGTQTLNITLNGQDIEPEPVFRLIRELYHAALTGSGEFRGHTIQVHDIGLNSTFCGPGGRRAGSVSYIRIPKSELGVGTNEHRPDPYVSAGLPPAEQKNPALIAYTRRPGMVVSYETSAPWAPRLQLGPDEYVIGFFVPDSSQHLRGQQMPFEEYLRNSEMADHMRWQDWTVHGKQQTIIKRIQQGIRRALRDGVQGPVTPTRGTETDFALGRALAEMIMPAYGFGGFDHGRGGAGTGGGGSGGQRVPKKPSSGSGFSSSHGTKRVSVKQNGTARWREDAVTVPVRLQLGTHDSARLQLRVRTEGSPIAVTKWEEDTGHSSPIGLCSFEASRIYADGKLVADTGDSIRQEIELEELHTPGGTFYGVVVTDRKTARHLTVDGLLTYRADRADGDFEAEEAD